VSFIWFAIKVERHFASEKSGFRNNRAFFNKGGLSFEEVASD